MKPCLIVLLSIAQAAPFASAQAQGQDYRCNAFVRKHCGDKPVGDCFANDAAWEKVSEACIGDVQTMIEMEREAREQAGAGQRVIGADG